MGFIAIIRECAQSLFIYSTQQFCKLPFEIHDNTEKQLNFSLKLHYEIKVNYINEQCMTKVEHGHTYLPFHVLSSNVDATRTDIIKH